MHRNQLGFKGMVLIKTSSGKLDSPNQMLVDESRLTIQSNYDNNSVNGCSILLDNKPLVPFYDKKPDELARQLGIQCKTLDLRQ